MCRLPHPISLMDHPLPKAKFNDLCKQNIIQYWHRKLSQEVAALPSLQYLVPKYQWSSLNRNPYQTKAVCIQALFLSGRLERLCRFWSQNESGICTLPLCKNLNIQEDLEHILLHCIWLYVTRRLLEEFTSKFISDMLTVKTITLLTSSLRIQFLLDCSVLLQVITAYQTHSHEIYQQLFRISRTRCRSLHVVRMKALGCFNKM